VIALVLWLRAASPPAVTPLPPRLVALDVGQGDALLVQGRRAAILVDGGRAVPGRIDMGAGVVVPALGRLGVRRLDVVVASHADVDHRGGLATVLGRMPVGALWLPAGGLADPGFARLLSIAHERRVPVEEIGAGQSPRMVGDLVVEPLWPPAKPGRDSANDRSIVARIRVDGDSVLLTGDVGRTVERRLLDEGAPVRARILKVAHHGSETSSDRRFLAAVGARVAVVSAGCAARSGLPRPVVLDRLASDGAHVAWTGRDGAILVALGSSPRPATVRSWGRARPCLVDDAARP
jgi:competence protein ComEC